MAACWAARAAAASTATRPACRPRCRWPCTTPRPRRRSHGARRPHRRHLEKARRHARPGARRAGARRACATAAGPAWRSTAPGCMLTDGRTAPSCAATGLADVAVFDRPLLLPSAHGTALAYAVAPTASDAWPAARRRLAGRAGLRAAARGRHAGPGGGAHRGHADQRSRRRRAAGVCSPDGADAAMKLGVNYPAGPVRVAGPLERRRSRAGRAGARWTTTTAANATASAPGCAAA
jgi:hypothetical protein